MYPALGVDWLLSLMCMVLNIFTGNPRVYFFNILFSKKGVYTQRLTRS